MFNLWRKTILKNIPKNKLQFVVYGDTNKEGARTFKNSISLTVMHYSNMIFAIRGSVNLARGKDSFKIQTPVQLIELPFGLPRFCAITTSDSAL